MMHECRNSGSLINGWQFEWKPIVPGLPDAYIGETSIAQFAQFEIYIK